ncbi:hypothetical protein QTP70_009757 [Hemibagrus guttatus]|uniref:Tyrosine-protein kinase ephrin type A/B receptor-like domain-containing protein n=1 Tax=Hemibagrus guttatus TaxID=175788 RepID=A0AAE0Q4G0_9TELE|nr:hypothetical protein QTP70_009757 [Hemibagrus guttatus]
MPKLPSPQTPAPALPEGSRGIPACPPGTFKSMQGTGLCLQCPPNSRSTSEASTICVCRNGYYRADGDLPDMPCTSIFCIDLFNVL